MIQIFCRVKFYKNQWRVMILQVTVVYIYTTLPYQSTNTRTTNFLAVLKQYLAFMQKEYLGGFPV